MAGVPKGGVPALLPRPWLYHAKVRDDSTVYALPHVCRGMLLQVNHLHFPVLYASTFSVLSPAEHPNRVNFYLQVSVAHTQTIQYNTSLTSTNRRLVDPIYKAANISNLFKLEDIYFTGLLPEQLGWKRHIRSIANRFPWRPHKWSPTFIKSDLMILELDRWAGHGSSTLVWSNILHHRGLQHKEQNHTHTGNTH